VFSGLKGDVSIPKASANSTAYWRSEKGVATQSDPTFTVVTLTPNRLTAYTEYTNQLLIQSSINVEQFVRDNLAYSVANALEIAAFEGSGSSNVPQGILNAGVNDATHGSTNPTACNWSNIVGMEKMIAVDNALAARMAYVMKATAAAKLKVTKKDTYQGGFIWENYSPLMPEGLVNGYPALVTNVFTNDTVIFGNFSELMIGQWGGLDILVNPYTLDTYDTVRVIIAGYYDVAVKHAESFARINDMVVA
jgi:HK97 family phage major capsid protein